MFTIRSDQNQIVQCPARPLVMERKWKPNIEIAPNCPRCASSNTKFCYYNNYSLSQPRYFCKGCRRYWTKGGSLRNVPVGGGCRKSRSRSSRSSSSERIGTNFVRNPPSPGRASNDPSIGSPRKGDGAADIDLAAVFAKFLNQNSGSDDSSGGANSSLELPLNSLEFESQLEDVMVESQMTSELVIDEAADGLLADFPLISNADNSVQVFSNQDSNSFGLQSLISNELTQGGLWSDGTNLRNNIIWQPMVQLQEFEDFSSDDQLKVSTSLVSDNWSLFDLPGCEIFSRP